MAETITKRDLALGFVELDRLSRLDYFESVWAVANASTDASDIKMLRLGRLLGVSMKEPFSRARARPQPTKDTHSNRAWTLRPRQLLGASGAHDSWQYRTLQAMAREAKLNPTAMALTLKRERNFSAFLFRSVHKYLCGDAKIRAKVKRNVDAARKAGVGLRLQDPEVIVGAGGLALGSYLVSVAPILGYVGAPVIAGLVLLLYTVGVDAFCDWVSSKNDGSA